MRRSWPATAGVVVLCLAPSTSSAAPGSGEGVAAAPASGSTDPTVGALFSPGSNRHTCTASVIHSSGHDLLLTAAHCLQGSGRGLRFVPGYSRGRAPYGVWTTVRAWADPRWLTRQDPERDYAVLQVAPRRVGGRDVDVEDVTGASVLGTAPAAGTRVTVTGYRAGTGDLPVRCTTTVTRAADYPAFDCPGYSGGTSGSPFLTAPHGGSGTTTSGVIGGLQQGGCEDTTSYSSPFDAATLQLLATAERGGRGDDLPVAGSSGC